MSQKSAFVREIRENPTDVTPRLIYADYLEEQGDSRGELIRLQCKLPKLDPMDPQWRTVRQRINELLETNAERWLQPLMDAGARNVTKRSFQRGLLERIVIAAPQFPTAIGPLCELEPALAHIEIQFTPTDDISLIAHADVPAQVTTVNFSHSRFATQEVAALVEAPWMDQLKELWLANCHFGDEAIELLVSRRFPSLECLQLANNDISDVTPLAMWETMVRLQRLDLSSNRFGDNGLADLVTPPRELETLTLALCDLGDAAAIALCEALGLSELTRLNLRSNKISAESMLRFADPNALPALEELDFRGNVNTTGRHGYGSDGKSADRVRTALHERFGDGLRL